MEEREYQQTMQKVGKFLALVMVLCLPGTAWAQYKNSSFGLDGSYVLFPVLPSIYDGQGNYINIDSNRPDRLQYGIRLGGEYNFKLHADHWWFDVRLDLTIYGWPNPSATDPFLAAYDSTAANTVGTVLGVDGLVGVRYYILTDHIRPYIQLGLSLEHLFSFAADVDSTCTATTAKGLNLCPDGDTFGNEFLPHTTFLGLHVSPSIEIILQQDIALHLILDVQRWVIFNADDNTLLTFGAGVTFY